MELASTAVEWCLVSLNGGRRSISVKKFNHFYIESFTADHKPLLGEDPTVRGFFHGCGFNSGGMMLSRYPLLGGIFPKVIVLSYANQHTIFNSSVVVEQW